MPIGNVNRGSAPKRETFRPPWVKEKDTEAPPPWTVRKLKPVDTKNTDKAESTESAAPSASTPLKPVLKKQSTIKEKTENGVSVEAEEKLVKPSVAKQADKASKPAEEKPKFIKPALKSIDKTIKIEDKSTSEPEKPILKSVRTIDNKAKVKSVSIVDKKSEDKNGTNKQNNTVNDKASNNKPVMNNVSKENNSKDPKKIEKTTEKLIQKEKPKVEEKSEMATKPPTPHEKTGSKLPPRKPSLQKAPSKDEIMQKKWRDPLHERVKENIDKTLNNEIPKGHTLTKNESLRSLLKPTPPPMPPPQPPKMPPPPDFKKAPIDPTKFKKLEQLRTRPRKRPDWSDMMKEVEQGRKLKKVVCNDRSSPIITTSVLVKNKDQFIFESEKPNSHNDLLKEINKGVKLKKVKTNDRSKPHLEGLRKFRRQMTIEEQVQKSMSQANLALSPSGVSVAEMPAAAEEDDIDEMDDIDKVRDDLQSTKQLLAMELRNREAQERENKRLLTRIQNLEAEVARERAIIKQEQQKTVISVTDAYDERLVSNLKMEVEKAKETADNLEKQYLQAADERDTAISELEELKRKNAELEKKLEQALSGIIPTNVGSRRSSHAIKQLSVTKDDSFEEEELSESDEEESEEKKQKRIEKEVRNMRNKIRHLKEKQDNMKRERMAYKMSLKNQQSCLKDEKRKFKELKREVDKMAAMMKEVGTDEEDEDEDEESEEEEEKKSESEEEETESETEQETESETESESEPEDAPLPNKKENLAKRLKRHETRVNALKKGNALLMANVDRLKDDVLIQKEKSATLKKELDSLIEDLD
ncbi:calponin homology domain-containing protein DDB_G0272472-like isoform X2 [Maniola hyperantus]|uniref:calponin homology domain-containing protein DDB_G0272472-like isoform X2 n=1 Tax=Aphantopus hyperantus TaxID=2795564 RepID=UPI001568A4FC|nr:DNA ligase 1-like [Maniola hyperantus]